MRFATSVYLFLAICVLFTARSASAEWSTLQPAEYARSEGALIVYDGGVFHFNGFDKSADIQNTVERYDIASDRWELVSQTSTNNSMPNAVTHSGIVVVEGELWVIGGRVGGSPGKVTDRVLIFDLEKYNWREGPKLPLPFAGGGAAIVDDRIHVFGGLDPQARCDVDTHLFYDLDETNKGWQSLTKSAPFPMGRNHFSTVEKDGLIYVIGGQHGHDNCGSLSKQRVQTKLVHVYDPKSNDWDRLKDMPWANSHAEPSTFVYDL